MIVQRAGGVAENHRKFLMLSKLILDCICGKDFTPRGYIWNHYFYLYNEWLDSFQ